MEEAVAAGYMNGFPDGSFEPPGVSTRAQPAKALATVLRQRASSPALAGSPGPGGTNGS